MKVILTPMGSAGDVHPFLALGLGLKARGHDVLGLTNEYFARVFEAAGIRYETVSPREDLEDVIRRPEVWRPGLAGLRLFIRYATTQIGPIYEALERHRGGDPLVLAGPLAFGSRIAQESLGLRMVTVQLAPAVFASCERPPKLPLTFMPGWMPAPLLRAQWRFVDWVMDGLFGAVNAHRADLGLGPARRMATEWVNSPLMVLGLFPSWFADPPSDWPSQLRLTGFPLYDRSGHESLPAGAEKLFEGPRPPIVFTPGSAMLHAQRFFEAAAVACRRLQRPGIFLTPHRAQLPSSLPPGVHHFDYLPLSLVLPRASALVYHGGIGTLSQACAAATPHVVVPFAYDQLDNAKRVADLGLGVVLPAVRVSAPRLMAALDRVINDSSFKDRCRRCAQYFKNTDPVAESCDLLERLGC